ncbi:hypothetical protein L593_03765 [Salinarchaeum sp. Harcht-Bsk1]|nr:hypothetical protein L593_03765 [Salinarchaeum sp. Harcht-Bsk1]
MAVDDRFGLRSPGELRSLHTSGTSEPSRSTGSHDTAQPGIGRLTPQSLNRP